jgi:peptide/nickel transport system ATP-binding protein/oligopeptide transport system ATP-binding protein
MSAETQVPLLHVEELIKVFREGPLTVHAVNGVSFEVYPGEAVGLVGESGCGKTTAARSILRLTEPSSGHVYFDGTDVTGLSRAQMRAQRRHMQMVFQDPDTSLNPRFTVRRTLAEPVRLHKLAARDGLEERLLETMSRVNLDPNFLDRYPHQLSEGQRQRVGVARAIITEPKFVALDEPTSALDMSVRIHMLALLQGLQDELGMTYIFISHDLSAVRALCNRVMVMYLGTVVESGRTDELFDRPLHNYTRALLSAIPIPDPKLKRRRILLKGEPPSLFDLPTGCVFHDRCPAARPVCQDRRPDLRDVGGGHLVACDAF